MVMPMIWVAWAENGRIRCTGVTLAGTAPHVARGVYPDAAAVLFVKEQEQHLADDPSLPVFVVPEEMAGLMMYDCCVWDAAQKEVKPDLAAFRARAKSAAKAARKEAQLEGLVWNKLNIDTSPDSVAAIGAKAMTAFMAGEDYKVSLKLSGTFHTFSRDAVLELYRTVDKFVQDAFDAEKDLHNKIDKIKGVDDWATARAIRAAEQALQGL